MTLLPRRFVLVSLLLAALAGCGDETTPGDPTCCENLYPVWCQRFAMCDPLTFSLSWSDPTDCAAEQVPACRSGDDSESLCMGHTPEHTEACIEALGVTVCDELFGAAGLPRACR